jgi:hypothetical protein
MVAHEMRVMAAAGRVRGSRARLHVVRPRVPESAEAAWAVTLPVVSMMRPPAGRPGGVARRGLVDRLGQCVAAKLALVVAPAGWGKTSLLREWWLTGDQSGRAWLPVGPAHNNPAQFWLAVTAALGTVVPGIDAAAVEAVRRDGAAGCAEAVLLDQLARVPGRLTLVLDDFHLITDPEVLEYFGLWLERLPPSLGLVVAARSDPDLPARLRAQGELADALPDGPGCVESGVALVRAACHHLAGDLAAAETAARRAAELELDADTTPWRAAALAMLGRRCPGAAATTTPNRYWSRSSGPRTGRPAHWPGWSRWAAWP